MADVKLGLVGLGQMGGNHLRVLSMLKNVQIMFACDPSAAARERAVTGYGIPVVSTLDEDSLSKVDGVIIASPTHYHFEYLQRCIGKVKHLFVEKPLTPDMESSLQIKELSQGKSSIQVGFIERFNPAVVALKSLLDVKSVLNADFVRTNKVSSRITDVDVIADLMIHDLDLAIHLLGPVQSVHAYGFVSSGLVDYARALIRHTCGSFSTITASRITEKRVRNIEVTCRDMYVACNLLSKEILINKQSVEQYYDNLSISARQEVIDVKPQEALLSELVTFVDRIRGTEKPYPGVDDALLAITAAEEIRRQILEANR